MKKILSLVLAAILLMALPIALADDDIEVPQSSTGFGFDLDITPVNSCPEIQVESVNYFVHTWTEEVPSDFWLLPATLGMEDLLDIAFAAGWAGRSYAFDGELIAFSFDAVDQDGQVDQCLDGFVTLDCGFDPKVVQCAKTVVEEGDMEIAHFVCAYYVEDAETTREIYGAGECWVSVSIEDECNECMDTTPGVLSLFLNPSVGITYSPQGGEEDFGFKYNAEGDVLQRIVNGQLRTGAIPGDTVYTPYFTVENSADEETGLYILLQMYGTDFRADPLSEIEPICGTSNRLEIENMEYKASHLNAQQDWTQIADGTNYGALEADYVFTHWALNPDFNGAANFLGVGDDITMRLRLHIPQPCQGEFNMGGDVMFVAAVI